VTLETIWHYRRMFLRPSYRKVGMLGVPYYALFECLAPLFQILSIVTLALAGVYGIIGWQPYLAFLGMMAFGTRCRRRSPSGCTTAAIAITASAT
jgi:hypothetical protein